MLQGDSSSKAGDTTCPPGWVLAAAKGAASARRAVSAAHTDAGGEIEAPLAGPQQAYLQASRLYHRAANAGEP